jgi:hypothetical protein
MELNERGILAQKRIKKMSFAIQDAIDDICKNENYEITYAEINAALIDVLKSNSSFELGELQKEELVTEKVEQTEPIIEAKSEAQTLPPNHVMGYWKCRKSPVGHCVYDIEDDPEQDSCIYCGDPDERK